MYYWYGLYLAKQDKHVTLDTNKLISSKHGLCTNINVEDDETLISKEDSEFQPTRKSRTQITIGEIKYHELVQYPFCGYCVNVEDDAHTNCKHNNCDKSKISFNNLDHAQHVLLQCTLNYIT